MLELRDLGLLKVFFGADPAQVAEAQLEMYRRKLAEYEGLKRIDVGEEPRGPWLTLDAGIRHTNDVRSSSGRSSAGSGAARG